MLNFRLTYLKQKNEFLYQNNDPIYTSIIVIYCYEKNSRCTILRGNPYIVCQKAKGTQSKKSNLLKNQKTFKREIWGSYQTRIDLS